MNSQVLTRSTHRDPARPALSFLGDLSLTLGRAHELCGSARRSLAVMIAALTRGHIFWIAQGRQADRLNADGLCRLVDPARFTFLTPTRAEDILWSMEEVLRSGLVPLVVADMPGPPGLVAVRRLHLAAETGGAETGSWPLGLLLTPDHGGAPGVESRWSMNGRHGMATPCAWRLERLRARTAPQKTWEVLPLQGQFQKRDLKAAEPAMAS